MKYWPKLQILHLQCFLYKNKPKQGFKREFLKHQTPQRENDRWQKHQTKHLESLIINVWVLVKWSKKKIKISHTTFTPYQSNIISPFSTATLPRLAKCHTQHRWTHKNPHELFSYYTIRYILLFPSGNCANKTTAMG